MNHRCRKLDMLLGKRLRITFSNGDIMKGNLVWDDTEQSYKLKNCMDDKKALWYRTESLESRRQRP